MIKAVSMQCSLEQFDSITSDRFIVIPSKINGEANWKDIDYLVLCSAHSPSWVAKIEEIVILKEKSREMIARLSEIRSLSEKNSDAHYSRAYESHYYNGAGACPTEFPDLQFYNIGDVVGFKARPRIYGPLSMDTAIQELADTYGVDPDQVEIIIRSKPVDPLNTPEK
ncbi:hypothetical protein [Pseudomonas sp. CMR5c]|uniref:hypothetical protein n=1 Tax=Pseudomonas sp. CMR5c TaxID=658630 RepID=UPI000F56314D|nr:hypothetical protein [Pseudomonas sp. CMR5c]